MGIYNPPAGGSGTVTSVTAGTGLAGGTFTSAGTISLITPVSVTFGGTGLSGGTSGGVLSYTSSGIMSTSTTLTANALVLGGGAGAVPSPMASLGTTTTVLHGNAAGAPTFGAVSLTTDISGVLPAANGGTGFSSLAAATIVTNANTVGSTNLANFSGTSGTVIQDSGLLLGNVVQITSAQTISNKTIIASSFSGTSVIASTGFYGAIGVSNASTGAFTSVTITAPLGTTYGGTGASSLAGATIVTNANTVTTAHLASFSGTSGNVLQDSGLLQSQVAMLNVQESFTQGVAGAPVTLVQASTVTVGFQSGNNFALAISTNVTLGTPTGALNGMSGNITITQDGSGNRTMAYGSAWKFSGGTAPTLTTTANAVDQLTYYVNTSALVNAVLVTNLK